MPNQDQVLGLLRNIIMLAGGIAIGRGWLTSEQVTLLGGVVGAAVPLVWTIFAHTDSAKIAAVTAIPEVKQVVVAANAPADSAAGAAAIDRLQPKVTKG